MTPSGRLALTAAAVVLVAGCVDPGGPVSGRTEPDPSPSPTAEPSLRRPVFPITAAAVLAYCPEGDAVRLDVDRADVLDVFVCTAEEFAQAQDPGGLDQLPGGGDDSDGEGARPAVQRASRVTGGADALLEAYAAPNAPRFDGACIELAADPLIVWVRTAESTIPVYAPVDGCGLPSDDAAEAYRALELTTLVESER